MQKDVMEFKAMSKFHTIWSVNQLSSATWNKQSVPTITFQALQSTIMQNMSSKENLSPSALKHGIVIPDFKTGDQIEFLIYRAKEDYIYFFSKVGEKLSASEQTDSGSGWKLIEPLQWDYMACRCFETVLCHI